MSLCVFLQSPTTIVMGADSRECYVFNKDKEQDMEHASAWRMNDEVKKIHLIGDKIIFTAGYTKLCENFISDLKSNTTNSIEHIYDTAMKSVDKWKVYCDEANIKDAKLLELLIGCIEETDKGKSTAIYRISCFNNYEIKKITAEEGRYNIAAAGVYTEKAYTLANTYSKSLDVRSLLQMVYSNLADEKVGGNLTLYALDINNGLVMNEFYPIKDTKILKEFSEIEDKVFGHCILSTNLYISNEAGTLDLNKDGMNVTKMSLNMTNESSKNKIIISPTEGLLKLQKNTGTINAPVWSDQISLDTNGDALFGGKVKIGAGNSIFLANEEGISLGASTWVNAPFRVSPVGVAVMNSLTANSATFNNCTVNTPSISGGAIVGTTLNVNNNFLVDGQGRMSANSAYLQGTIHASSGTIGGWSIGLDKLSGTGIIQGGKIVGARVESADIIGGNINVQSAVYVGDKLYMNPTSFSSDIVFTTGVSMFADPAGRSLHISANSFHVNGNNILSTINGLISRIETLERK